MYVRAIATLALGPHVSLNAWLPGIRAWVVPAGPLKVMPGWPGWPSATFTPLYVRMWWAEKFSAMVCVWVVRFVVATLKSTVTGPVEMSYASGLLMNPVGEAAEMIPSKLGFPRATTPCDVSTARPRTAVPARANRPPARLSGKAGALFMAANLRVLAFDDSPP